MPTPRRYRQFLLLAGVFLATICGNADEYVIFHGKVTLEDGSPPGHMVQIQRTCEGAGQALLQGAASGKTGEYFVRLRINDLGQMQSSLDMYAILSCYLWAPPRWYTPGFPYQGASMAKVDLAVAGAGRRTFELSGATVRDILDNIGAFPAFSRNLLGSAIRNPFGDVFLNGVNVQELPLGQETQVGADDLIRIAPEFGGSDSGFLNPQLPELSLDSAALNITLSSPRHTISDVAWLVNSIDNLAMACVWGSMQYQGLDDSTLRWARNTVRETVSSSPQAQGRFYPNLPETLLQSSGSSEKIVGGLGFRQLAK